jgi:hypothetical protein
MRDPLFRYSELKALAQDQLEAARDRMEQAMDEPDMWTAQGQTKACRAFLSVLEHLYERIGGDADGR